MDIPQPNTHRSNVVPSILTLAIFLVIIALGGVALSQLSWVFLPAQASLQARNTDGLVQLLLLIGGIVFTLVHVLLIYSIFKFRAKANDTSDGAHFHGNTTLEVVWTIIPAVVVAVLAVLSYDVWVRNSQPQEQVNFVNGESITMRAIGARYAWTFEYDTNVPLPLEEGQTLAEGEKAPTVSFVSSQLHTYVGQHVKLEMSTRDVIHSFWVPAMRVKQDLLPGRVSEVRFDPIATAGGFPYRLDENGVRVALTPEQAQLSTEEAKAQGLDNRFAVYRVVCTELCGSGHGEMYAELFVHENEEAYLANFFDRQVFAVLNPPDDPVQQGRLVLQSGAYPCANCHILSSQGWVGVTGPSLNGIGQRAARRVGGQSAIEYLATSIMLPNEYVVPGYAAGQMPHFGFSDTSPTGAASYNRMPESDLIAIIAYLCTQTESGDPAENACGLEFADGTLVDIDAAKAQIEAVTSTYRALFGTE